MAYVSADQPRALIGRDVIAIFDALVEIKAREGAAGLSGVPRELP
jgi:hypothetical protein